MTHSLYLTIYGYSNSLEAEQVIEIEYEGRGYRIFRVESLKILTPLEIDPSDLYNDISDAILKEEQAEKVFIECVEVETLKRILA